MLRAERVMSVEIAKEEESREQKGEERREQQGEECTVQREQKGEECRNLKEGGEREQ